jgi:spectinomycin phosphotransferase
MLEKPDLPEERIAACLRAEYGLSAPQLAFLPLGADLDTAVYRALAKDGTAYFVKLRRGDFSTISLALPKFLSDQGLPCIIPPLSTHSGPLWAALRDYKLILYAFIEGQNAYERGLSEQQWSDFGAALNRIHSIKLPLLLSRRIPREAYAPLWRNKLRSYLALVNETKFRDPLAAALADFIRARQETILDLVRRADRSARGLLERPPHFVLCHADVHAGNILIESSGAFYIVDWDEIILAPKERDLMSIGAGLFGAWRAPKEEETLFYRGYGETQINLEALTYYRCERIIDDLAIECEQIFLNGEGGKDREQAFHWFKSNFQPGNTIELARKSDPAQGEA